MAFAKRPGRRLDMKSHYLSNKIGRILLALSFMAGIGLVSSVAVQAQRPWDRDQDSQDQRDRNYRRDRDNDRDRDYNRNDQYGRNRGYGNNGGYGGYGGYGNASQIAINQ